MPRKFARLLDILGGEAATEETLFEFSHLLQHALLLALQEQGRLNVMQYRHAQDQLNRQRRERGKALLEQDIIT